MEPTECSKTSAFNIQTSGKYPEDNIPYLQHGESLKTMKSSPVTGLEWPRGFQEVKVPRFLDNGTG
jgi:hypothetical protein